MTDGLICYCGEPVENDPSTEDGQAYHVDRSLDTNHQAWIASDEVEE